MPFIAYERRRIIDQHGLNALYEIMPGDRCYVFYKQMVERWRENPRWTTAHEIYRDLHVMPIGKLNEDDWAAKDLAWQVFFVRHVLPYEERKCHENGDI